MVDNIKISFQEYVLRLDSTLARASNDYTLPEVVFTANCTFKHFTLKFNPQVIIQTCDLDRHVTCIDK